MKLLLACFFGPKGAEGQFRPWIPLAHSASSASSPCQQTESLRVHKAFDEANGTRQAHIQNTTLLPPSHPRQPQSPKIFASGFGSALFVVHLARWRFPSSDSFVAALPALEHSCQRVEHTHTIMSRHAFSQARESEAFHSHASQKIPGLFSRDLGNLSYVLLVFPQKHREGFFFKKQSLNALCPCHGQQKSWFPLHFASDEPSVWIVRVGVGQLVVLCKLS